MSRKDILTPRERFGLLVIDEKPDRCNIIPLITSHAASVADIKLRDYYTNGFTMAKSQIAALDEYQHDAISIFSEVGIIAEAMGSVFDYPDNDLPIIKEPALEKGDVDRLRIPDPTKDGRLPIYMDAIRYCYESVGDRVPILAYVPAPFTTGMMLSDPNKFLIEIIKNPERIKRLMDVCLEAAIRFSYEIIDHGGLPVIVDPLASSSVISPRAYKNFALPYERGLIDFLHRYDLDIILHICGDTGPIVDLLPETHADLVSLDRVDMKLVFEKLQKKLRIIGNFDTSKIGFGNCGEISEATQMMILQSKMAKKGYIAATGCEVPIRAPVENVKTFIESAREVGWYWD